MRRIYFVFTLALAFVVALVVSGCSGQSGTGGGGTGGYGGGTETTGGGTGTTSGTTVTERGFAFEPATLTVKVGDTVSFVNEDSAPHEVKFDSGEQLATQSQGDKVTWTAEKPGTYPYSCSIHPSMRGEIIVE